MDQQADPPVVPTTIDEPQSAAATSSAVESAANPAVETAANPPVESVANPPVETVAAVDIAANTAVETVVNGAASIFDPVGAATAVVASAAAAQALPLNSSAPNILSAVDQRRTSDADTQTAQPMAPNPSTATSEATSLLSPSRASSENQYLHPTPALPPSINLETQPEVEPTNTSAAPPPTEALSRLSVDAQSSKRRAASDPPSCNAVLFTEEAGPSIRRNSSAADGSHPRVGSLSTVQATSTFLALPEPSRELDAARLNRQQPERSDPPPTPAVDSDDTGNTNALIVPSGLVGTVQAAPQTPVHAAGGESVPAAAANGFNFPGVPHHQQDMENMSEESISPSSSRSSDLQSQNRGSRPRFSDGSSGSVADNVQPTDRTGQSRFSDDSGSDRPGSSQGQESFDRSHLHDDSGGDDFRRQDAIGRSLREDSGRNPSGSLRFPPPGQIYLNHDSGSDSTGSLQYQNPNGRSLYQDGRRNGVHTDLPAHFGQSHFSDDSGSERARTSIEEQGEPSGGHTHNELPSSAAVVTPTAADMRALAEEEMTRQYPPPNGEEARGASEFQTDEEQERSSRRDREAAIARIVADRLADEQMRRQYLPPDGEEASGTSGSLTPQGNSGDANQDRAPSSADNHTHAGR